VTTLRPTTPHDDEALVALLRGRDEEAFRSLVERYHPTLVRMAMTYVPSRAVAEEVAQETWLGVLRGIDRFEGRSSLKTWLFTILANIARTKGVKENRSIPFASTGSGVDDVGEPMLDPERLRPADGSKFGGWWSSYPQSWDGAPEERMLGSETRRLIDETIQTLPPAQREVITLRDIDGWTSVEVCEALQLSEANQRVLLHRARTRVRNVLEEYLSVS
jgi:RNA polymerase sigma-70 factor, ECF subfamily